MSPQWQTVIEPKWEEIDATREAAASFLAEQGAETDCIDAVTMVLCELTENAIKYGRYDRDERVDVRVRQRPGGWLVEVTNPVGDGALDNLTRLDESIQWIRGFQDPFEAYVQRLRDVSLLALDDTESGLGLVRIAYEGQATLDFFVDANNRLAVSALYQR
jgi:hypothetical protein